MPNQAATKLLEQIFPQNQVKVVNQILKKDEVVFLRDIARETGVPLATTFRIAQRLKDQGLLKQEKRLKFTVYVLNKTSDIYKELKQVFEGPKEDLVTKLKNIISTLNIAFELFALLDRKDTFVILTDDKDRPAVQEALTALRQTEKFNPLFFSRPQFESMLEAGIFNKARINKL